MARVGIEPGILACLTAGYLFHCAIMAHPTFTHDDKTSFTTAKAKGQSVVNDRSENDIG